MTNLWTRTRPVTNDDHDTQLHRWVRDAAERREARALAAGAEMLDRPYVRISL